MSLRHEGPRHSPNVGSQLTNSSRKCRRDLWGSHTETFVSFTQGLKGVGLVHTWDEGGVSILEL